MLLDKGANVNVKENLSRLALMQASKDRRTEIVEWLKAHGATE